jgi:GABA(A) receptor-associated protein
MFEFKPSCKSSFKTTFTHVQRSLESCRILAKHTDRRPVICERASNQSTLPNIDKTKYLVPTDLTVGQFMYVIRKRLKLTAEQSLFFIVRGEIPSSSETMLNLYTRHCDTDQFLYISYMAENAFGC